MPPVGPREIRTFSRMLEEESAAMHDVLRSLATGAYLTLRMMTQKQFWQSQMLQQAAAIELKDFWDSYQAWKR